MECINEKTYYIKCEKQSKLKKKLKYCDSNTIKILKEKFILKYQRFLVWSIVQLSNYIISDVKSTQKIKI